MDLLTSKAIETGLVEDIEDCKIFIRGIGKDKVSDMVTNIIKMDLIKYTQEQCNLWDIPMVHDVPSGFYWNSSNQQWENKYTDMPIIGKKKIILVPKARVSFTDDYIPEKYYNDFVLNYLRDDQLQISSSLVRKRKNGDRYITKKDLMKEYPYSKEFLIEFTKKYPEIFKDFKTFTGRIIHPLKNKELEEIEKSEEIDLKEFVTHLIGKLDQIPPGNDYAKKFHMLIFGILDFLFYPDLFNPKIEQEIHEGRKRIDISFNNGAKLGFFHDLHDIIKIPCPYIFIECKNYSTDPNNPELDQLGGRFAPTRGKFGFLVCRTIDNIDLFFKKCHDTYEDERGMIFPITDLDLKKILDNIINNNYYLEDYLRKCQQKVVLG